MNRHLIAASVAFSLVTMGCDAGERAGAVAEQDLEIVVDHYLEPCSAVGSPAIPDGGDVARLCYRVDAGSGFETWSQCMRGLHQYAPGTRYTVRATRRALDHSADGCEREYDVQEVLSTEVVAPDTRFTLAPFPARALASVDGVANLMGYTIPIADSQEMLLGALDEHLVRLTVSHAEAGYTDVAISHALGDCETLESFGVICGGPCYCPDGPPSSPMCEGGVLSCGEGLIMDCAERGPDGFDDCQ